MADIASLGIKVTTQGAKEAAADLNKLADASQQAATGVKTASDAAKKASTSFKSTAIREQREELTKLLGQIDPTVAALGRLDAMEQRLGQFRKKGIIDSETFSDASKKINESRLALTGFGVSATKTGLSAKQMTQALRQVPMQFTDIATSLASGQRPLQVFLQQGGQLKDVFGGVGPALRAMGGYVVGLINPLTVAALAVGGLALAWKKAADEGQAFERALILTGNQADLTADQMRGMAASIDGTTNATAGKASAVLSQVAATGKFTAEQIALVAQAAINLEEATGRAIEKTISEFVELEKAPVDAILRLNDAVGDGTNVTNFLTEAQIKAIEKFKQQGREADATRIAVEAYAAAINDRTPQIVDNLTLVEQVWRAIGKAGSEAGDAFVNAFRNADIAAKSFLQNQTALATLTAATANIPIIGFAATSLARLSGAESAPAKKPAFRAAPAIDSAAHKARKEAEEEFARLALSNLSKRERLEAEIKDIRELGLKAGKNDLEIQKEINNARARYEESLPKGAKPRKPRKENTRGIENASDRFDDMVGRVRAELDGPLQKAESEHLRRMREIEQAARDGKRSHEDLAAALALEGQAYSKTTEDIQRRFDAEVASLSGPVAQAQNAHEQALHRIDELVKQANLTTEQRIALLNEEAKAYEQDRLAAERAADPIGALLSDMAAELDLIGKSNAERAVMIELRRQNIDAMSAEGQAAIEVARTFEEEARAKERSIDLMDEFRSGASNALADIVTGAKSAKEAFADFFDDLAARITQMIADQWIEKLFGPMGSDGGGTTGGGWLNAIMGMISGGTTTTSGGWWANGGAFQGGNVMAFANGGVVDSPTNFGMSGGRIGLMGEAGPEAILPLHRGPDGKLGVRMAANDDQPRRAVVNNNTTFVLPHLITPQSQSQMAQRQQQVASRASRRN